jgi:hypothetical protein
MSYVKLHASILNSTVWAYDSDVRCVWIAMLAMADRDGFVASTVPGLARRACVSRDAVDRALALFLAPDPDSSSKEFEGRRIAPADGGWTLLNHSKYQESGREEHRKRLAAERQARWRQRNAAKAGARSGAQ